MKNLGVCLVVMFLMVMAPPASAADHPWQISSAEGDASVAFGVLAQAQGERVMNRTGGTLSQDVFLRRFRLIVGGKLSKKISFFIETDTPNLGKGTASGGKVEDRIYLQDAVFTYTFRPEFQLEGGMILPALSRNGGQSAASLLTVDYGPYSFVASDATGSRVGRDYGVQARGYLFNKHLEYRAGVFQGNRSKSSNDFRYFGRVAWYPFEADTGLFYTGTTLGAKKMLSLGASFDHQMEYNARSFDFFYDQPIRHGDAITMQADYSMYDGGSTFTNLPRQHIWLLEAGYYHRAVKLGPFVQLSNRLFTASQTSDLKKYIGGIAYWPSGHKFNVKLGVGRSLGTPAADSWQVVLQGQVFVY